MLVWIRTGWNQYGSKTLGRSIQMKLRPFKRHFQGALFTVAILADSIRVTIIKDCRYCRKVLLLFTWKNGLFTCRSVNRLSVLLRIINLWKVWDEEVVGGNRKLFFRQKKILYFCKYISEILAPVLPPVLQFCQDPHQDMQVFKSLGLRISDKSWNLLLYKLSL